MIYIAGIVNFIYICPIMESKERFYFNDYGSHMRQLFDFKVQKISIDGGFTCPNRDGTKGTGGCTYCNNRTFNPAYCHRNRSVTQQMKEGINFFSHKYPQMRYLAYFQAYTNTYESLEVLQQRYEEALGVDGCVGLVIGTRPDCMPESLLDYLEQLACRTYVMVEYGVESTNDKTLLRINRGHDFATAVDAIQRTARRGLPVGVHIILGLPGEERSTFIDQARLLSTLPITTLKLHQLQLIRGTRMAEEFEKNPEEFHLFDLDDYIEVAVDYLENLRPDIVVERFASQSPKELLIAPDWGLKNHELVDKIKRRMRERNTWQGKSYNNNCKNL